jgi:hypothetical protein
MYYEAFANKGPSEKGAQRLQTVAIGMWLRVVGVLLVRK